MAARGRGEPPAVHEAVADVVLVVAQLVERQPRLEARAGPLRLLGVGGRLARPEAVERDAQRAVGEDARLVDSVVAPHIFHIDQRLILMTQYRPMDRPCLEI